MASVTVMVAAAECQWLPEERFELKGFSFALCASKCGAFKLEVLSATGELFIGAWDVDAQVVAGFVRKADAESRLKMLREGLSGYESMTTTLTAVGSELKMEIKVPMADYFAVEIELRMQRAEDCQSLSAWLKQMTVDCKAAKCQLTDARSEYDKLKAVLCEALEEFRETNAKMEKRLAKANAQAAASHRFADDLRAGIRIRELEISALRNVVLSKTDTRAKAHMSTVAKIDTRTKATTSVKKSAFLFDITTKGGETQPKKWQVSANGKNATAKKGWAQILVKPTVHSGTQLSVVFETIFGKVGVGVTDAYNHEVGYEWGLCFYSDGDVYANGHSVAKSQAFGHWQWGDRLFVSADMSNGTVTIRAPNGQFTAEWSPRSSQLCFAVYSYDAGTKVRIA